MITLHKLSIYSLYSGDLDLFTRSGRESEKRTISDKDWYLIDILIQDANVIVRGLGSEQRLAEATERLAQNSESGEVVKEIMGRVSHLAT